MISPHFYVFYIVFLSLYPYLILYDSASGHRYDRIPVMAVRKTLTG